MVRVGMLPVADDAEPLELLALHVDPVLGEGAALAAEFDRAAPFVLVACPWRDIPPRSSIRSAGRGSPSRARSSKSKPSICWLLRHHVLEDLVERGADMDVAVGVGRAVVQDEARAGPWRPRAGGRRGRGFASAPAAPAPSAAGRRASGNRSWAGTAFRCNRAFLPACRSWAPSNKPMARRKGLSPRPALRPPGTRARISR